MTGAIIIAAGMGRSGYSPNPFHPLGMITALQQLIITFRQAEVSKIVVVAHKSQVAAIQKNIAKMGAVCLGTGEDSKERLDFVKEGIRFVEKECDQVFITPVNIPFFSSDTLLLLLESPYTPVKPVYQGRGGHPLLLPRRCYEGILTYMGKDGLEGALRQQNETVESVLVEDEKITWNLLKNPEYKEYCNPLRVSASVRIARDTVFFGPGAAQLLELIESQESVRMASCLMGISYTKAWNILKKIEQGIGFQVVSCQQGGKSGGQARLTSQGSELLRRYREFEKRSQIQIKEAFHESFGDFLLERREVSEVRHQEKKK